MRGRPTAEVVSVRFGGGKRDAQILGLKRPRTTLFLSLARRGIHDIESVVERVREALEFLWRFRDHHDPLTLGHASNRTLSNEAFVRSRVPDYRRAPTRKARRRAVEEVREVLLEMGNALGSRPPFPPCRPDPGGWSPERVGDVFDAALGLYAGLLHR